MKNSENVSALFEQNQHLVEIVLDDIYKGPGWRKLPEDRKNDLLQAGRTGLIEGFHHWDEAKGKVGPTVRWWIYLAITAELDNSSDKAISVTKHGRARARKERDQDPENHTSVVLAEHFNRGTDSIDEFFDGPSEALTPEALMIRAEEEAEEEEITERLAEQMKSLDRIEAAVVREMVDGKTAREVGKLLGLTGGQVEIIYKQSIWKLRSLNNVKDEDDDG